MNSLEALEQLFEIARQTERFGNRPRVIDADKLKAAAERIEKEKGPRVRFERKQGPDEYGL